MNFKSYWIVNENVWVKPYFHGAAIETIAVVCFCDSFNVVFDVYTCPNNYVDDFSESKAEQMQETARLKFCGQRMARSPLLPVKSLKI